MQITHNGEHIKNSKKKSKNLIFWWGWIVRVKKFSSQKRNIFRAKKKKQNKSTLKPFPSRCFASSPNQANPRNNSSRTAAPTTTITTTTRWYLTCSTATCTTQRRVWARARGSARWPRASQRAKRPWPKRVASSYSAAISKRTGRISADKRGQRRR